VPPISASAFLLALSVSPPPAPQAFDAPHNKVRVKVRIEFRVKVRIEFRVKVRIKVRS